jgi:Reverse transcriptase (RNA-dependent DNA polymerase)
MKTGAQVFSKVAGKDFSDSHAPVMTDFVFRVALIICITIKLCSGQFDIETAYLYSESNEEIYMRGYVRYMLEVHNRVIDPSTHVLLLKKAIYGLVQVVRQWWKMFKELWLGVTTKHFSVYL